MAQATTISPSARRRRRSREGKATTPSPSTCPAPTTERELIHEILDLEAGDRIIISQYQFATDVDGDPTNNGDEDPFGLAYGEDGATFQPFKFRIDKIGDDDWTFVDVFIQQDAEKDFSIEILGSSQALLTY